MRANAVRRVGVFRPCPAGARAAARAPPNPPNTQRRLGETSRRRGRLFSEGIGRHRGEDTRVRPVRPRGRGMARVNPVIGKSIFLNSSSILIARIVSNVDAVPEPLRNAGTPEPLARDLVLVATEKL